MLQTKQQGN